MAKKKIVSHEGIVQKIKDNTVFVHILSKSACATCKAKSVCTASDMSEKVIEAVSSEKLKPGDTVSVEMDEKLGWLAVFYTFGIPFVLIMVILFSLKDIFGEGVAAVASIISLAPYYFILWLCKNRFKKQFIFTAVKVNNNNKRGV